MAEHGRQYGPAMMLMASLCFSIGGVLIKCIPWNALAINGARNLIAAAVIGIYLIAVRHKLKFNGTVAVGAFCMFGVTTFFALANKMTTAGNAIVLQYTAPVWIIIFMLIFKKKRPSGRQVLTVAVVIAGIIFFLSDSLGTGHVAGDMMALLAGIFYAGVFMLNDFEKGDAISSMFFGQLLSGVVLFPFMVTESDYSGRVILAVIVLGAVQVGLAYILFNEGTKYTEPVTAAIINAIEPILNPLWAVIFIGEVLGPKALAGAAIVITAVVAYNVSVLKSGSRD